jgi:methylated-DNA-protein-cysteine methyltransferase-like protein
MATELADMTPKEIDELRAELDEFSDRVYWIVKQIPSGRVATYGQIAMLAGSPNAARAVGNLMKRSLREYVELPWQRVINASGGISFKGDLARAELQLELLQTEGVAFDKRNKCDLDEYRWNPDVVLWENEQ